MQQGSAPRSSRDAGFQLNAKEEEELVVALEEIRSGNEDGHELLRELRDADRSRPGG